MKSLSFETKIRYKRNRPAELPKFTQPSEVIDFIRPYFKDSMEYEEEMRAIFLDKANRPISVTLLGKGTVSACIVNTAKLYQTAILANCSSVILVHNHPSGNLKPSIADKELTEKVKKGLDLLDFTLVDSLIITKDSFVTVL